MAPAVIRIRGAILAHERSSRAPPGRRRIAPFEKPLNRKILKRVIALFCLLTFSLPALGRTINRGSEFGSVNLGSDGLTNLSTALYHIQLKSIRPGIRPGRCQCGQLGGELERVRYGAAQRALLHRRPGGQQCVRTGTAWLVVNSCSSQNLVIGMPFTRSMTK